MSNLPTSSKYVSTPDKPVDEREREAVVARVNAAFETGAVGDVDYRSMLDIAFRARTLGELRPVVEHLPAIATYETPGNIESATLDPGQLTPARQPSGRSLLMAGGAVAVALVVLAIILVLVL